MKYRNVSDKVKMLKKAGEWVSVRPGDVVELPESVAEAEGGFEEVKEEDSRKELKEYFKKGVQEELKKAKPKSREELEKMTKDGLNDYAAVVGLKKVSQRMKKSKLVNSILRYLRK